MPIETLIERWFAIGFLIFGLSHLLYPAKWAALFLPLRDAKLLYKLDESLTADAAMVSPLASLTPRTRPPSMSISVTLH